MTPWLAFPYRPMFGRSAERDDPGHVRDMLEQVLFTAPGERVNRPDFGCGLSRLLFAGNAPELAVTVEMTVRGALQRWLGHVLSVEAIAVAVEDSTLRIDLSYMLIATGERAETTLTRPVA